MASPFPSEAGANSFDGKLSAPALASLFPLNSGPQTVTRPQCRHQRFKLSLGTGWAALQGTRHPVGTGPGGFEAPRSAVCWPCPAPSTPVAPASHLPVQDRPSLRLSHRSAFCSCSRWPVSGVFPSVRAPSPPPSLSRARPPCSWAASFPPSRDAPFLAGASERLQRSWSPLSFQTHVQWN